MEKRGPESKHARGREGRGRLPRVRVPRHAQPCARASRDVSVPSPRSASGKTEAQSRGVCSCTCSPGSKVTVPARPPCVPVPVLPPHLLAFACAGSPRPGAVPPPPGGPPGSHGAVLPSFSFHLLSLH